MVPTVKRKRNPDLISAVLFLAPILILISIVTYIPVVSAFRTSMHATSYAQIKEFVGFRNYVQIFTDGQGLKSIKNSVVSHFQKSQNGR